MDQDGLEDLLRSCRPKEPSAQLLRLRLETPRPAFAWRRLLAASAAAVVIAALAAAVAGKSDQVPDAVARASAPSRPDLSYASLSRAFAHGEARLEALLDTQRSRRRIHESTTIVHGW